MSGVASLISTHLIGGVAVLGLDYIVPYNSGSTGGACSDTAQVHICPMDRMILNSWIG